MARKRMISPEIWESQSFSLLSDLAKIVFISLFSHADDEGRGIAKPTYIMNTTFPYDENRRVADIKKALSEIALKMSVQFYNVNGNEYYVMQRWERWQKIDKPSKSKLPPPPVVGEGGAIPNSRILGENSPNIRGEFAESSATNIIEDNKIENNILPTIGACAHECKVSAFCNKYGVQIDNHSTMLTEIDFDLLEQKYSESEWLRTTPCALTMSWICHNYCSILANKYKDKTTTQKKKSTQKQRDTDIYKELFAKLSSEENDNNA